MCWGVFVISVVFFFLMCSAAPLEFRVKNTDLKCLLYGTFKLRGFFGHKSSKMLSVCWFKVKATPFPVSLLKLYSSL